MAKYLSREDFGALLDELQALNRLQIIEPDNAETYRERRYAIQLRLIDSHNWLITANISMAHRLDEVTGEKQEG